MEDNDWPRALEKYSEAIALGAADFLKFRLEGVGSKRDGWLVGFQLFIVKEGEVASKTDAHMCRNMELGPVVVGIGGWSPLKHGWWT